MFSLFFMLYIVYYTRLQRKQETCEPIWDLPNNCSNSSPEIKRIKVSLAFELYTLERSSRSRLWNKKGVLKIFAKVTGKHVKITFKSAFSCLRQFLSAWSPLKMIKMLFISRQKPFLFSRYLSFFVLTFWSYSKTAW